MKFSLQATIRMNLILGSIAMTGNVNSATGLETTHWQLVQYFNEPGDTTVLLQTSPIEIKMSDGRFNGTTGCNSYFGSYQAEGEQLTFNHPIGATMKACAKTLMDREYAYLELLEQVRGYHIDDETMVLLNKEQEPVLKFTIVQPIALEKTQWQATGINNGNSGVVSTQQTERSTAQFFDGKLTGNAGCNQYSAGYTVEKDIIIIGPVMTTRMECPQPDGIMQQEGEYLKAISGKRFFTLDSKKLELRDEVNALQVRFSVKTDTEITTEKEQE